MINKTELDMQRTEVLWLLQVYRGRYFLDSNVTAAFSNPLTPHITWFQLTDRQMDKINCLIPLCTSVCGIITLLS